MRIGLISDTHGQLRNAVLEHFEGVDLILHAGDVGEPDIIAALEAVAPVEAVFGNTDGFRTRSLLRDTIVHEAGGRILVVVHGDRFGAPTPARLHAEWPDADVVVFGHTHRPTLETIGSTLFVNPGAAGPARHDIRPSVAILSLDEGAPDVRFIEID
ncbi:MAG: metallophosphoesterase family protein [Gemmatimonadota bacterium]